MGKFPVHGAGGILFLYHDTSFLLLLLLSWFDVLGYVLELLCCVQRMGGIRAGLSSLRRREWCTEASSFMSLSGHPFLRGEVLLLGRDISAILVFALKQPETTTDQTAALPSFTEPPVKEQTVLHHYRYSDASVAHLSSRLFSISGAPFPMLNRAYPAVYTWRYTMGNAAQDESTRRTWDGIWNSAVANTDLKAVLRKYKRQMPSFPVHVLKYEESRLFIR
jgi:hypothetical protein